MHRLLSKQLQRSTRIGQAVNVEQLCTLVEKAYTEFDIERARTRRATQLMMAEIEEINRLRDETHAIVKQEHDKLEAAISHLTQGLAMFGNDGRLVVCNPRLCEIFSLPHPEPGTYHTDIAKRIGSLIAPGGNSITYEGMFALEPERRTLEILLRDGRWIAASFSALPGGGWIEGYFDVTEQHRAAEQIQFLARHDPLTSLPNRRVFNEVIVNECERAKRGASIAVLCLDLDHFKCVNDTLGHPLGDKLLKEAALRLRSNLRTTDTVARLGGDEFAIVQVEAEQPQGAMQLAKRIIEELSKPYFIDGHQIVVGTSVGIAMAPNDGTDADVLVRNADMALYRAKSDGRGTFRFFETGMDVAIQKRRRLELDLRRALKCKEFELHYQPLIDLASNRISSCEALIRWNHPITGRVPPDQFIPIAEEIGLIFEIGEWVLHQACATASAWAEHIGIAVNISPAQFKSPGLVQVVRSALQHSGLAPSRLELEITETVLLQDTDRTLAILHELRGLGVRIAMDDFGTGYSSLSYLRKFPFDKLKIDRSFVSDLGHASEAGAIVRAVTELAANLGMRTTAEGVETLDQREALEALNCSEIQGYLISPPVASKEISALLLDRQAEACAA